MKNSIIKAVLSLCLVAGLALPAGVALADPYISISNSGSNNLSISVNGGYGQVDLVYTLPGSSLPTIISNIGNAYSGSWNGSLNLSDYGIVPGSQVYVRVGGQQSNTITVGNGYNGGCTYNCGSPYGLSLSQNNVYLTVGQSQAVSVYSSTGSGSYGNNSIYIASNSNPSVVSAAANSANQISLYGLTNGSSTISVCTNNYSYGSSQNCASIYVTVGGSVAGANTNLYFSPSSPTMYVGQDLAVSINSTSYASGYYGSTAYYISSNSNSNVVSANISGTVLNLHAYQSGSSTITVCHSSLNFCGTLYVTVNGGGSNNGNVTFSQNNLNFSVGQAQYITVYSNGSQTSNFYVASNSSPSAVNAYTSNNQLYVYGQNTGNATLSICLSSNSNSCASLYVNVGSTGGNNGNITFSQNNPNLSLGQSLNVTIYGGTNNNSYYLSANSNSSIVTASVSGNTLYLYGKANGSATVTVCQNNYSNCGTLNVNVNGGSNGNSGTLSLSQYNLTLTPGQSANVNIYGNGSYYIASNSNSPVASASLSSSNLNIYASSQGNTSIAVCQNSNYQCMYLQVTVTGSGSGGVLGASTYKNGQLIKEGGTIYIVYRNSKSGFANWNAFNGFGFKLANVTDVSNSGLNTSGYVISTSNASHPWGSWVKSGNTVYFVHEQGLIPVPDWNTFLNNGGQAGLIVNANLQDFSLPILSPMVWNDSRLN